MAGITVKLKELRDAQVDYISLVDRAATRIPFRILKRDQSENPMSLDLTKPPVSVTQKGEALTVSAIIVDSNGPCMDAIAGILFDNGFDVSRTHRYEDDTVAFLQDDTPMEDTVLVRVSDMMLVTLKGFDAINDELREHCEFSPATSETGYFAGLSTAIAGFGETVMAASGKATKAEDLTSVIESAGTQLVNYLSNFARGVPAPVFKADRQLQELAQKLSTSDNTDLHNLPTDAPEGITQNDWDALNDEGKIKWMKNSTNTPPAGSTQKDEVMKIDSNTILDIEKLVATPPQGSDGTAWAAMSLGDKLKWLASSYNKANASGAQEGNDIPGAPVPIAVKGDDCPPHVAQADWDAMDDDEKAEAAKKPKAKKEDNDQLLQVVSDLADVVSGLAAKLDAFSDETKSQIDAIARKSDDVTAKVKGVVIAPAVKGDTPGDSGNPPVQQDDDPRSGCFDTAFLAKKRGR